MSDSFDTSGLDRLAADLGKAAFGAEKTIPKALEVTARKIKDAWNQQLYTSGHAKYTGHSITYDVSHPSRNEFEAEIGAVRGSGKQAYIARLLEYGSVNNPPHGAGSGALDANTEDFVHGIQQAAIDGMKESGL